MKTLQQAIREKDFVVTAALPLRPNTTADDIRRQLHVLRDNVDAVQLVDDRKVQGAMSTLAAAAIVTGDGVDAVVHMSCRDRNRYALHGDLLGAAALGVSTLILSRGEKIPVGDGKKSTGMFDLSADQLFEMAANIAITSGLAPQPDFLIGAPVTAFSPRAGWQATRIAEKIGHGARLLQAEACLDGERIARYMSHLVMLKLTHKASVLVDVPIVSSLESIALLRKFHSGAPVPASVEQRMATASDPRAEGLAICGEVLATLRTTPGVSGVNILYDRDAGDVIAALHAAGIDT